MRLAIFFILLSLTSCSTIREEIHTCIFDGSAQPPLVGAELKGYDMDDVLCKGIIVSEDSSMLTVTDTTRMEYCLNYRIGYGARTDKPMPYRCIDCTPVNKEQYWCPLYYLKGNTKYFVRAFMKDHDGNIFYGDTKSVTSQSFNRYPGYADYANVFCWREETLFDKITDEIIDPEKDGFFYSTNEDPNFCKYQEGYGFNTCYKFKTEWSYLIWYYTQAKWKKDIQKKIPLPLMYMENGRLVISSGAKDKVYYNINDKSGSPTTYNKVYTEPLDVPKGSRIDCYSVNENGEVSYLNRYWR